MSKRDVEVIEVPIATAAKLASIANRADEALGGNVVADEQIQGIKMLLGDPTVHEFMHEAGSKAMIYRPAADKPRLTMAPDAAPPGATPRGESPGPNTDAFLAQADDVSFVVSGPHVMAAATAFAKLTGQHAKLIQLVAPYGGGYIPQLGSIHEILQKVCTRALQDDATPVSQMKQDEFDAVWELCGGKLAREEPPDG